MMMVYNFEVTSDKFNISLFLVLGLQVMVMVCISTVESNLGIGGNPYLLSGEEMCLSLQNQQHLRVGTKQTVRTVKFNCKSIPKM
jgi:hypothetical protein